MGYATALGIAESDISLETGVSWHFQTNCYPPVPQYMVPVAVEAILCAVMDEWDDVLDLPEGVTFRGQDTAPVASIISDLHLDAFVDVLTQEDN